MTAKIDPSSNKSWQKRLPRRDELRQKRREENAELGIGYGGKETLAEDHVR